MKTQAIAGTLGAALAMLVFHAYAQTPPYGSSGTEKTGTIASSGVYQQVFPPSSNGARKNCLIENTGSANQLVFFGNTQPANSSGVGYTMAAPVGGANGGWITCGNVGGGVITTAVWIEGTAGDTYEYTTQP